MPNPPHPTAEPLDASTCISQFHRSGQSWSQYINTSPPPSCEDTTAQPPTQARLPSPTNPSRTANQHQSSRRVQQQCSPIATTHQRPQKGTAQHLQLVTAIQKGIAEIINPTNLPNRPLREYRRKHPRKPEPAAARQKPLTTAPSWKCSHKRSKSTDLSQTPLEKTPPRRPIAQRPEYAHGIKKKWDLATQMHLTKDSKPYEQPPPHLT